MKRRSRHHIIEARLEQRKKTLLDKRENLQKARVEYEAAREEFAGTRRVASEILGKMQWLVWQNKNPEVRFLGVAIGDAITELLRNRAQESADRHIEDTRHNFRPAMTLDAITNLLEDSGFEFRTLTPRREVNAALRHLKDVDRNSSGKYQIADAKGLLERTRSMLEGHFEEGFREE